MLPSTLPMAISFLANVYFTLSITLSITLSSLVGFVTNARHATSARFWPHGGTHCMRSVTVIASLAVNQRFAATFFAAHHTLGIRCNRTSILDITIALGIAPCIFGCLPIVCTHVIAYCRQLT